MKRFALVLAIVAFVLPAVCFAGPFGFNYGMTKEQVIAAIGRENVVKDQGPVLRVISAPKPDKDFEAYSLLISPEKGLLKIIATGITIDTSEFGTELKVGFGAMRDQLSRKYGKPANIYDFLQPDSNMDSPTAFTEALRKRERVLAANWDVTTETRKSAGPDTDHLVGVILETKVLRRNAGWLEVTYEFEGFKDLYDEMQKQADQARLSQFANTGSQTPNEKK